MDVDPAARLRSHGLAVTAQRLAVLRAVAAAPHCTADEIGDAVRSEIGAISKQAVYDALRALVESELVRRIQPAHSPARFEDRVGDNHHHVICRACGRMEDVDCAVGARPCLTPSDDAGFEIDEAEVIYWGRCPTCSDRGSVTSGRSVTPWISTCCFVPPFSFSLLRLLRLVCFDLLSRSGVAIQPLLSPSVSWDSTTVRKVVMLRMDCCFKGTPGTKPA